MRWFRLHTEILNDPKVQRLSATEFRTWINLLCIANDQADRGQLPPADDLAYMLRLSVEATGRALATLIKVGLIERVNGCLVPHNWSGRQYESDAGGGRSHHKGAGDGR